MLSLLIFFLGILILVRGRFRLFGRDVTQPQSRSIGAVLMAPLVIEFCASTILMYNYEQINPDGGVSIDPNAFIAVADTIGTIELIAVIVAVGYALMNIYSAPQTAASATSSRATAPPTPARAPDIMTITEAAAYMRVSEDEVLTLINEGKLAAARIGDNYRIARIAIDDFMSAV